jgi:putative heme-binding domain-containing protein
MNVFARISVTFGLLFCLAGWQPLVADDPAASLLRLLKSGRVPKERLPAVFEQVCARGEGESLGFVFQSVVAENSLPSKERLKVLKWLADAAVERKQTPSGDITALGKLLSAARAENDVDTLRAAVRLASLLKPQGVESELSELASTEALPMAVRKAAIDGLALMSTASAEESLANLATGPKAMALRFAAAAAIAHSNLDKAAHLAAAALATAVPQDEPDAMLESLLARKEGPDKLAAELKKLSLDRDVAKRSLRYMYSVGRSDAALSEVLSIAAGVDLDAPPPTLEQVAELVKEVDAKGDAARGEKIFRRGDLSCMKCHAVSKAGGNIGPELSGLGGISPTDYIANSILNPNLAIKEQFVTKVIETNDGLIYTGIAVDRDANRLRLRLANGAIQTIPLDEIDTEEEGKSLMPQGLTKFLTHQELLDLIRFVSQLGKPGEYGVPPVPSIQRWQVLRTDDPELTGPSPNLEAVRLKVLAAPAESWTKAYGMVAGKLPLEELRSSELPNVLFLKGELNMVDGGEVEFDFDANVPIEAWIDERPATGLPKPRLVLGKGTRSVLVRVSLVEATDPHIQVKVIRPAGSTAQLDVVGGP